MLRVVGGQWKGRRVPVPKGRNTRPALERVREAVFSALEHRGLVEGREVVDLYAGSGSLGIEALSRGAARAVFVEYDERTAQALRKTLEGLEPDRERWRVTRAKVETWLGQGPWSPGPLLILMDPPFPLWDGGKLVADLFGEHGLPADAVLVSELPSRVEPVIPPNLELWESKRYGDSRVLFLSSKTS
ncbi:MAG: 16S rRNA (guanine(966)-N(2))-methyltransferase RsmD [Deltaproteobacteria bacterium]|nr:16S rRNA (guanine(966)-N(2))-methyltransferase RsmD [Deltaproteobacteria bacterium]